MKGGVCQFEFRMNDREKKCRLNYTKSRALSFLQLVGWAVITMRYAVANEIGAVIPDLSRGNYLAFKEPQLW